MRTPLSARPVSQDSLGLDKVVVTVKGESCDALVKALWYAMKKRQLNTGGPSSSF